jgi:ABC-type multidrug transport system fused ATPase/permease subunit
MRMNTGNVKLVLVDEPSSAMDPEAEHRLFQNLRNSQAGKTLICITHRFGHLTKYADLIICLKDGLLVEQGHHKDLMDKRGEYFNMYNVQAQGFSTGATNDC